MNNFEVFVWISCLHWRKLNCVIHVMYTYKWLCVCACVSACMHACKGVYVCWFILQYNKWLYEVCLQPENILLDDQLNVKLSDFGFATVVNDDHELTGEWLISCHMTTFTVHMFHLPVPLENISQIWLSWLQPWPLLIKQWLIRLL